MDIRNKLMSQKGFANNLVTTLQRKVTLMFKEPA